MRENTARPIQQDTSDDIDYIEQRAARAHHGEKKDVGSRLRQATEELQQARRFLKEQILSSDAAKNYPKTIISGTGRQAIEKSNEDNIVSLIIKKIVKSDPKNDWEEYIFGLNEDIERMEDEVEQLKKERKKEEQRDKVEGIDLTQLTEQTTAKANLQLVEDQQRVSDIREQISQVDQEQEKETRIFNLWNKLVALRRKLEGVKTGWFSKIEFQGDMPTVFNINNLKSGLALKGKYDIMALMRRNQLSDSANLTQFYDLSQQMEALLNERRQKEEQRRAANVARIHERTREKNRLAAAERKKAEEELNAEHADFWMSDENETINPHTGKKEDRTQLNAKLVMEEVNAKDEAEDTRYINESFMAEEADFERRAREEIKAEEAKKQKKDGLLKRIAKILGIGGAGAAALLAAERGTDQDNRKVELKITNQPAKIMELNAADMADLQQSDAKSILEEISNLDTTNPDKPVIKVNRTSSKPSTNKESGGASKKQAPAIDENNPSSQSEA